MESVEGTWFDQRDFELTKVKSMEKVLNMEIMLNHGQILKHNIFCLPVRWLGIVLSCSCHLFFPRHNFPICKLGFWRRDWTRWYQELFQFRLTRMLKFHHLSDFSLPTCFPYLSLSLLSFSKCPVRLLRITRIAQGDRGQEGHSQTL